MLKSRSEGSLTLAPQPLAELGDTQKTIEGRSQSKPSTRNKGLSKEEANCFRRFPAPSSEFDDKVAPYWRDIGKARTKLTESGCHTLPSGKGAFWSGPQFMTPILSGQEEFNLSASSSAWGGETPCSKSRRSNGTKGKHGAVHLPHPLDKEEEHLARILGHLFPSTKAQMARVGSSYRRGPRHLSTPKSRESSTSFGFAPGESPTGAMLATGDSAKLFGSDGGPVPESPGEPRADRWRRIQRRQSQMQLLKRDADRPSWQVGDNALGANAVRLVKGAAGAGAVHREYGGGAVSFVQDENASKGPAYRAGQKAASTVAYLVQAMRDPSQSFRSDGVSSRGDKSPAKGGSPARTPKATLTHEERKAKEKADSKNEKDQKFQDHTFSLRQFRKRILEHFSSVTEAFNSIDVDASKNLTMKEWKLILHSAGLASAREARILFEIMDANKDGNLTMLEFHVGVESMAPVLSLEGLRKRLLCLGCTSMMQALLMMNGGGEDTTNRPLTFPEFSQALIRAMITEPAEHRAIWEAVRSDPAARSADTKVAIADLACALSAASPCMLLEELRSRLLKRHTTLDAAWKKLTGSEASNPVSFQLEEFTRLATERLNLKAREAAKAFRLIDIDDSGEVDMQEFIGAMNVSGPSLLYEDLRHKVRQRFLSIDVAFREAFEHLEDDELNNETALEVEDFADILEKLDLTRQDTARLFGLIDGTNTGKLTLFQFFKGIRLFAPASRLEGVRLQMMLHNNSSMADAICSVVPDRLTSLDRKAFGELLQQLEVQCNDLDHVFDFLDVRDTGIVTVSEIIAALQNIHSGSRKLQDPGNREERAESFIKCELAPFHRTVVDLKRRVKQGLRESTADGRHHGRTDDEGHGRLPKIPRRGRSMPAGAPADRQAGEAEGECDAQLLAAGARLRSADARTSSAIGPQGTYYKLHRRFKALPAEVQQNDFHMTMDHLKGYFNSAHTFLQGQKPILAQSYSRTDNFHSTTELNRAIESQKVTDMRKTF